MQPSEDVTDDNIFMHNMPLGYNPRLGNSDSVVTASSCSVTSAAAADSSAIKKLCFYVCDVCSRQFLTCFELRRHRGRHRDCAMCRHCGGGFRSMTILRHHRLSQCSRKLARCNVCHELLYGWPDLSRHTAVSHPAAFVCAHCGQAFLDVDRLVSHCTVHAVARRLPRRYVAGRVLKCATGCKAGNESVGAPQEAEGDISVRRNLNPVVEAGCCAEERSNDGDRIGSIAEGPPQTGHGFGSQLDRIGKATREGGRDDRVFERHLDEVGLDSTWNHFNEVGKMAYGSGQLDGLAGAATAKELSVSPYLSPDRSVVPVFQLRLTDCGLPLPGFSELTNGRHAVVLHHEKQAHINGASATASKDLGAGNGRVTCAECSRTFKRLPDLHVHMRCHTDEMRYGTAGYSCCLYC